MILTRWTRRGPSAQKKRLDPTHIVNLFPVTSSQKNSDDWVCIDIKSTWLFSKRTSYPTTGPSFPSLSLSLWFGKVKIILKIVSTLWWPSSMDRIRKGTTRFSLKIFWNSPLRRCRRHHRSISNLWYWTFKCHVNPFGLPPVSLRFNSPKFRFYRLFC